MNTKTKFIPVSLKRPVFLFLSLILILVVLQPAVAQNIKTGLDMFVTSGFNNTLKVGETSSIFIGVRNSGTTDLSDIEFSAKNPPGWTISFNPPTLASLTSGSSQAVEVNITPAKKATSGDYYITVIAQNSEVSQVLEIFTPVAASPGLWILIGGIIAAVVVATFVFVYFRLSKR